MKDQDREEYTELLRTCNIPVQEWRRYAFLGHRQGCSRNLIYEDKDRFALTLCCWDPGYQNEIHDHNDSACYFKILHGIMQETHFQDNERKADKEYGVGDVCHMSSRTWRNSSNDECE
uniref:Cysteine dioxygenase n=1 Tax=Biomphalaria glabrata TaxID=6526 RepID=A0A2C9L9M6_BIOGL